MKIKKLNPQAFAACACFLLSACGESVKTIEYYASHEDEAVAMLTKCQTYEPMKNISDQNCKNANIGFGMRYKRWFARISCSIGSSNATCAALRVRSASYLTKSSLTGIDDDNHHPKNAKRNINSGSAARNLRYVNPWFHWDFYNLFIALQVKNPHFSRP